MKKSWNEQLVEAYPNRRALRQEYKTIDKKIAEMRDQAELLHDLLYDLDKVTHIIDGVALHIDGAEVYAVDDEHPRYRGNPRWTSSYINVRDGGTGLELREWREQGGYDSLAINTSMGPRQARKAAIAWVLKGEIPEDRKNGWMVHGWIVSRRK